MRVIITAILTLCYTSIMHSQSIISGQIVDANQQGIPASISAINNDEIYTEADFEGVFELQSNLKTGDTILVEYISYRTDTIILTNNYKLGTVQLEEDAAEIEQLVVTGTKKATYLSKSPVKVEVITKEHLKNFQPSASNNIVKAMELVSGIEEVVGCGVCYTNSLQVNGLPGQYTAVLIDGVPMYGNLAAVYGLNGIASSIIERVEVIKGPNSTLYGSEAMAGVINIITKYPSESDKLQFGTYINTHLESSTYLSTDFKAGKHKGIIGVDYTYSNRFVDENNDLFSDEVLMDKVGIFNKWLLNNKHGEPHSLMAKYYGEDRRNGVKEYVKNRNHKNIRGNDSIYGESIYTHRGELYGRYNLPTKEQMSLDYALSGHWQDSYYGADNYTAEQYLGYLTYNWFKTIKKHELVLGGSMKYEHYNDNTVATTSTNPNTWTPSLFIQDEWAVNPNWTLLGGIRSDFHKDNGVIFSPRLSTKHVIKDYTTLRLNSGTGFKVVNLFTEDHAFVSGQRQVVIANELKPERSFNLAANLRQIYSIGAVNGSIELDGHYNYFTNKIVANYDQTGLIIYDNVDGNVLSQGGGITVAARTKKLETKIGFSILDAHERVKENGTTTKTALDFSSDWSALGTVLYKFPKKWTAAYKVNINGPTQLPEVFDYTSYDNSSGEVIATGTARPTKSAIYAKHSLQLKKQINHKKNRFDVYFGIDNIFDKIQKESPLTGTNDPNSPLGFSEYFDTSYAYAPIHGRAFYIGIDWTLK